jgi:hypothetical protein
MTEMDTDQRKSGRPMDFWEAEVPMDSDFQQAAELFGGALDLRAPEDDPRVRTQADADARDRTRHLFLRPLNIFHAILKKLAAQSPRCASMVSQVRAGYLYSTEPNAFCWQAADRGFVGVTSGFGHFIHGWAAHLLSMPEFLTTFVAGAEEESAGDIAELRDGFDFDKIMAKRGPHLERLHRMPRSTPRILATFEIAHMAMLFAFLHEFGHFVLRHPQFARDNLDIHFLRELREDGCAAPEYGKLCHLFELMADNFAVELALGHEVGQRYGAGPTDGYAFWSIGVDLTLWLFGHGTALTSSSASHPHPQVRLMNKVFKLMDFEKAYPGRIVCRPGADAELSIDRFCMLASLELAQTWQRLALPGWTASCLLEDDAQRSTHAFCMDVTNQASAIREKYEAYADWSLLSEVVAHEYP